MKRTQKLEIRLTEEEMEGIERGCRIFNMSKSEYVRRCVVGGGCNIDVKRMTQHVYEMQSVLNRVNYVDPAMDDMKILNEELHGLWQCLR